MVNSTDIKSVYVKTGAEWRDWLETHGQDEKNVRLILFHKSSQTPSIHYEEAVEQALCFGWIDNKTQKRDETSSFLFFTPRNPKSTWSKSNRERAEKMIAGGLMTPSGQSLIDIAKKKGTWDSLAEAENEEIPADLQAEFEINDTALKNFKDFSGYVRRAILEWVLTAKRPETRRKRIIRVIELARENRHPFMIP